MVLLLGIVVCYMELCTLFLFHSVEGSFAYNVTVSERLGTSSSKEQYAYMYRCV